MTDKTDTTDLQHMRAALGLARRGLGRVAPNPAVGCILVAPRNSGGRILGRGWTQPGGRPHAEVEALARAGDAARGATAYVTLEPCAHHGQTPPCADALVAAGIKHVVIATLDADPRSMGLGVARLEDAEVHVTLGVLEHEARRLNEGFFLRIKAGRPLVTLKMATTLDGRIATRTGQSQWITGEAARRHAHRLRAEHDAIIVGIGTARADDPSLTCRLPGMEDRSPVRVVLDTHLSLPISSKVVETAREVPTWIVVAEGTAGREAYEDKGVDIIDCAKGADGHLDMESVTMELGARGITRAMVEGGGKVAAAFLKVGMVDEIAWFRAPSVIGADGIPAMEGLGVQGMDAIVAFAREDVQVLGDDVLETYRKKEDR